MPDQMKPCPFCKCSNTRPIITGSGNSRHCLRCGAKGPDCDTEEEADERWNARFNENVGELGKTGNPPDMKIPCCGQIGRAFGHVFKTFLVSSIPRMTVEKVSGSSPEELATLMHERHWEIRCARCGVKVPEENIK